MFANHVDLEFFDAVSSYVTAMIHSFIKTNSVGMVLKKKKYAKGFVNKLKKCVDVERSFDDLIISCIILAESQLAPDRNLPNFFLK